MSSRPGDPLPGWNDGHAKSAILDFIARTTVKNGPDFIPPARRIAVFDNDGTLWCEQPVQVQLFFALDRLQELATMDPTLRKRQPFKAFLERDLKAIAGFGKQAAFQLGFATHAGLTTEEFDAIARRWLASAVHPQLGRLFTNNVYAPQLELLRVLRDNAFKIFIVSGGGSDFIRTFSEEKYGISPERVIGSSVKVRFDSNGRARITKLAEIDSWNDREAKPANIYRHVGRRPCLAFGNSDGDLSMLRYVNDADAPSLALLLHHDDEEREFAYDREFKLSPLVEALDNAARFGFTVVSMKHDWRTVFGDSVDAVRTGAPHDRATVTGGAKGPGNREPARPPWTDTG